MKQTQTLENFQVYIDGQLQTPTHIEALQDAFKSKTTQLTANARKQARMALYDLRRGTQYRKIYNELARQKRNREFEASIGLVKAK